ncbi:MAG TPA: SRPBCC family protein [Mycobacteriales bacterium]|nr:SRPBCC family protein [Mycobacteriales bacterium]
MTSPSESRIVTATREIRASAERIFELIADPAEQPRWDGNDNLNHAEEGQRVRAAGEVFTMSLRRGGVRENTIVEFEEGRLIAWLPNVPGRQAPGHLWRWELEPVDGDRTRVTHTYDWANLTDRGRFPRARATTAERLAASLERLAVVAENDTSAGQDTA